MSWRSASNLAWLQALPGVRQVVPPLPFGEESVLLDVAVPAHATRATDRPWVVLEQWHILRQPTPRLLVCDEGSGIAPALEISRGRTGQDPHRLAAGAGRDHADLFASARHHQTPGCFLRA